MFFRSHQSSREGQRRKLIRELFVGKRWTVAKTVFFVTLKAAPVWTVPIVTSRIIDLGNQEAPQLDWLLFYVAIAVVLIVQNLPAALLYMNYLVRVTRGIGQDLRIKICKQLQALSLHYHNRHSVGSLHTKAIRDIEILEQLPRLAIEQGYGFFLGLTISIIAISIRKPEALLFFFVAVPFCAVISGLFRRRISGSVNEYRKSMEGMSLHLNELVTMMPISRAHAVEENQLRGVESGIQRVFDTGVQFDKLTQLFSAVSWVTMWLMQILFLGGSMYACMHGQITIGDVVMFNAFFLTLSNSLANLLVFVPQLLQTRESLDSVIEILSAPDLEANEGKPCFENVEGDFRLEKISYQYPEGSGPVLRDLSLRVEAGTSLAIAGPSGGGKSTLLYLLLGFIRPDSGRIFLDGDDMATMDLRSYRKHVGVVTQDSVFFSGTVRENIAFGKDDLPEEAILMALDQAYAREFVEQLPEGIHTRLGVGGVKLSGGQMQRLAIARAIVRDPKILILDEATSALDLEAEAHVQRAIENAMKHRTTFLVAHRISTVKNADRIAVLESGRLIDCASPAELMAHDNFYSRAVRRIAG